jgi:hypothetical protein
MKRTTFLLVICIFSFGCACSNDAASNSNKEQKPSQPTPPIYASAGLGLSRSDWERQHGSPTRKDGITADYEGGRYWISFADDNVSHLEYTWGDKSAVSLDDARSKAKSLIPSDAKFVRTYVPREARLGDLYFSESLKTRFQPVAMPSGETISPWIGGKTGEFLILYRLNNKRVTSFAVAIGNNT